MLKRQVWCDQAMREKRFLRGSVEKIDGAAIWDSGGVSAGLRVRYVPVQCWLEGLLAETALQSLGFACGADARGFADGIGDWITARRHERRSAALL
jgi:hypothetical protein